MITNIGIGWQLHDRTGWGIYGINLTLQLLSRPNYNPIPLFPPGHLPEHPIQRENIRPAIEKYNNLVHVLNHSPNFKPASENLILLQSLGNNFAHNEPPLTSPNQAGIIFFENTLFNRQGHERAAGFPLIITGSHWNEEILKNQNFSARIETVIQGIDPTIFHPAPKSGLFKDRFVIFSGGKLEYRKGQDIVIAAFKIFQQRHPEALLLAAWHNSWPESMAEIVTRGYVEGLPDTTGDQQLATGRWLCRNDLPENSFLLIPSTPNIYMASIIREADVALFPNRGEGGTNLVAMETLATGTPVILAANSGQLDFADPEICYPLTQQNRVQATPMMPGVTSWGESSVDEIVETLEKIYTNPQKAAHRGHRAVKYMQNFTWEKQIEKLMQILEKFF